MPGIQSIHTSEMGLCVHVNEAETNNLDTGCRTQNVVTLWETPDISSRHYMF